MYCWIKTLEIDIQCELQRLQYNQEAENLALEEEVQQMRAKHSETIQKLKAQFLQEKKQFQDQSDSRIQAMAKQANQVRKLQKSTQFLTRHDHANVSCACAFYKLESHK